MLISHDWNVGIVPEYTAGFRHDHASMFTNHLGMVLVKIVVEWCPYVPEKVLQPAQSLAMAELAIARALEISATPCSRRQRRSAFMRFRYKPCAFLASGTSLTVLFARPGQISDGAPPKFADMDSKVHFGVTSH